MIIGTVSLKPHQPTYEECHSTKQEPRVYASISKHGAIFNY